VNALKGKIALVTGASRGIGRAIALALGREGALVVGTATSESGAEAIAQALSEVSAEGTGIVMDVNDAAQVDSALEGVQARYGEVAVLVNNAGITRDNLLLRMKDEEWNDIIATNLTAVFRLSRRVVRPMMKARYGRIINITSVIGATGNAGQANYAAAKAGVVGFTKSLARELGSRGITANCVAPGFIETDMTRALSDEQRKGILDQVPLARLGRVEDVAHAVVFLASPSADYITGCTLHVNGGMHMD
jgi:3-oxoacyl-[acyl-carrier protein] reductase